jgi:glutamyl-tRNA synthetase
MVRTRFAPSPTGFLHIGSARTALFCWLYAKKKGGTFILRIEDTDLERSTPESVQAILESMAWLQLDYAEGPIFQTKRFDRYLEVAQQLLLEGKAYRCTCSKERLEKLRAEQMEKKQKPRYDGHCRNLNVAEENKPYVIRFKNPVTGAVEFNDLVRGKLSFQNDELDDLIIVRSDGSPTYNFTVVVDDWDMKITHVIRGDDHINNTPRQINILQALQAEIPQYAHVPMILGSDGKRLSKRHGAVSVMQYREEGYLAHALINYLARLGWSYGDKEIFSRDELIEYFSLENINRAAAAFNTEKLLWLNHHYIKTDAPDEVAKELVWHMQQLNIDTSQGPALTEVIIAQRERTKTLREMAERSRYFYADIVISVEMQVHFTAEILPALQAFYAALEQLSVWEKAHIHAALQQSAQMCGVKLGKLAQPVRVAVTGGTVSPPLDVTLSLLGKEKTLARLAAVLKV